MPFWLFIAVELLALTLINAVVAVFAFYLAARCIRAGQIGWKASAAVGSAFVLWATAFGAVVLFTGNIGSRTGSFLQLANLGLIVVAITIALRRFGGRTLVRSFCGTVVFLIIYVVGTLGIAVAYKRFLTDAFVVPTEAMAPTLETGDKFLVDRWLRPHRWDVIAFRAPPDPGEIYVKRLIGLPGETVELVDGEVMINGKLQPKPASLSWLHYESVLPRNVRGPGHGVTGSPIKLGADEYFVLGDNSPRSLDSRHWQQGPEGVQLGALPGRMIVGTGRAIYSPWVRARVLR